MRLFKRKHSDPLQELAEVIGDDAVPAFPASTATILRQLRDLDIGIDQIAQSLQYDPGLVVRVLKTVNSAAFGLSVRIADIGHAVHLMGRSQLESIVLALTVKQVLPEQAVQGFDAPRYWQTAARRAALARTLADQLHPGTQADCFTSGLLQDMAVPVLASKKAEYGEVLCEWHAQSGSDLAQLERSSFGWDHAQLGALMGESWELPAPLIANIRSHHPGGEANETEPAAQLVGLLRERANESDQELLIEAARGFGPRPGLDALRDRPFRRAGARPGQRPLLILGSGESKDRRSGPTAAGRHVNAR